MTTYLESVCTHLRHPLSAPPHPPAPGETFRHPAAGNGFMLGTIQPRTGENIPYSGESTHFTIWTERITNQVFDCFVMCWPTAFIKYLSSPPPQTDSDSSYFITSTLQSLYLMEAAGKY